MVKKIVDLVFTTLVLISSVYLWLVTDSFPVFPKYKYVDSDFWPKIILLCMGILSVAIIFENVAALRLKIKEKKVGAASYKEVWDNTTGVKKMILMSVLCITYYWGLNVIGFMLSTIIFMLLAMLIIGGAKKITLIIYPIVFTVLIEVVFVKLLELSLPRGIGIFNEISLLFY